MTKESLEYRFLPGLPPYGLLAEQFSATGKGLHSEGVVVEFTSPGGASWVGNFQPGEHGGNGFSAVELHPNGRHVVVVAGGQGYVLDPDSRTILETWTDDCVALIRVDECGMLICMDGDELVAIGSEGELWRVWVTDRSARYHASYIDVDSLRVTNRGLEGRKLFRNYAGYNHFRVQLDAGRIENGDFCNGG